MGGRYGSMKQNIERLKALLEQHGEMRLVDVARRLGMSNDDLVNRLLVGAGERLLLYETDDRPIRLGILPR